MVCVCVCMGGGGGGAAVTFEAVGQIKIKLKLTGVSGHPIPHPFILQKCVFGNLQVICFKVIYNQKP